jgi:hypothetical protein
MIPEFTQDLFLRSLGEWGVYPARFRALPEDEQAGFLRKQGFSSMHDMLAHVGVWWEEAQGIILDTIAGRERPRRKYDFDEFNAASVARFRDTPDADLLDWYETRRREMISMVSSIDAEQMKIRRVHGWLDAVTLLHLKEHGVGAPLFLVLDMLKREWAAYPGLFRELAEGERSAFLEKQGFSRLRDVAAHVVGCWEEGLRLIDSVARDPSYRPVDKDADAFTAGVLASFAPLEEADIWKKYESTRAALIEALSHLPVKVYEHKLVQDWLKSDVIEHYFDHAV